MARASLPPPNRLAPGYVARAFFVQYNVILLGGAVLFSLASASPIPLAVGFGLEAIWLLVGPKFPWFRAWVDRMHREAEGEKQKAILEEALHGFDQTMATRLWSLHALVRELCEFLAVSSDPDLPLTNGYLNEIEAGYLDLSKAVQRLSQFLTSTPHADLESEAERLRADFTRERDLGVRLTLRQAIKLAEGRLAHRERVTNTRRAVELKLDAIDRSLAYVRSQARGIGPNVDLTRELATLAHEARGFAALEAEVREALNTQGPPTADTARPLSQELG
jgi:hypothetical protein